ncbi:GntR family transcriptional regulator [Luteimonas changyuni]|uniref:GntR family transcriptional regulator n=1 Tax=Luteimonas sp. MJ145 TaxID=3129234 RepID=UPI0031BB8B24
MNANYSKSAFLHRQVRRALQSGRYLPGQRIDPAMLATEFRTSPTPVRFALYRLVGEGLLSDHSRGGLYVPLPTEVALRDLYDWMERLLLMACDIGVATFAPKTGILELSSANDDVVKLTWQLFDDIARATAHRPLHQAVKQANDRLAPIRRAKKGLFEDTFEELSVLNRHWQVRDIPALRSALHDYHERRKQLVPCIVALLSEGRDHLH